MSIVVAEATKVAKVKAIVPMYVTTINPLVRYMIIRELEKQKSLSTLALAISRIKLKKALTPTSRLLTRGKNK
jgi:hypothetical protein